jgi:hypothetical protein
MKFESTLSKIAEAVFSSTDFKSAQNTFIDHVDSTNVKDKNKMIEAVKKLTTLTALQHYCANALLKFEGLGLSTTKTNNEHGEENNNESN